MKVESRKPNINQLDLEHGQKMNHSKVALHKIWFQFKSWQLKYT